jgi:hypothetical protein
MSQIGRSPRIADPIDWPRMVASRMPVSVIRSAPYFACSPSKTRFTSPSLPTSSPMTKRRGSRAKLASKLRRSTCRPSTAGDVSEYSAGTTGTFSGECSDRL